MISDHVADPEAHWYVRTTADRDTHRGTLRDDGNVHAECGEVFRPIKPLRNRGPALPGEPPDPEQVCLTCCKVVQY